jgi:hypothetical protein
MNPQEQNYHGQEKDLGIGEALCHWRSYLHGQTFLGQTYHAALQSLTTKDHLTPRQVRWLERLIDFDFKIFHISGKVNLVAKALFRSPKDIPSRGNTNQAILLDTLRRITPHQSHNTKIHLISSLLLDPQNLENLRADYTADREFQEHFRHPRTPYSLRNGLLHFNESVCVPIGNIRLSLLHNTHNIPSASHIGVKKTAARLSTTCHWKSLKTTVQYYVKSCDIFQRTKNSTQKPSVLLQSLSVPTYKWASISMDFITPLSKAARGNAGLFVFVDRLSKLIRIAATPAKLDAPEVARLLITHVYRHHGLPLEIISDRDPIFMSKFLNTLFRMIRVKLRPSSAYHPETDG